MHAAPYHCCCHHPLLWKQILHNNLLPDPLILCGRENGYHLLRTIQMFFLHNSNLIGLKMIQGNKAYGTLLQQLNDHAECWKACGCLIACDILFLTAITELGFPIASMSNIGCTLIFSPLC